MRYFFNLILLFGFLFVTFDQACAQKLSSNSYDHEIYSALLDSSEQQKYDSIVAEYRALILEEPNNALIHIEYCKFINIAMYDSYNEENPNQAAYETCFAELQERYPNHPGVLLHLINTTWGEKRERAIDNAYSAFDNSADWSDEQKGILFYQMANKNYENDKPNTALAEIEKAEPYKQDLQLALLKARIQNELGEKENAISTLVENDFPDSEVYQLYSKASLLFELDAFDEAALAYNAVTEKDSSYVGNGTLAKTFEQTGKYELARSYFLKDTSNQWNKLENLRLLFAHDLKHQEDSLAVQSYQEYRDEGGFYADPFGAYRLRLFLKAPFRGMRIRDLGTMFVLLLFLSFLILFPLSFILPIHTYGHRWNADFLHKHPKTVWGLKSFWLVGAGYFIATFVSEWQYPESLNSYLIENSFIGFEESELAFSSVVFMIVVAIFTAFAMYRTPLKIYGPGIASIGGAIGKGLGYFLVFTFLKGIYLRWGFWAFDMTLEDMYWANPIAAGREDIVSVINTYGKYFGFALMAICVPIYEEIMFRGIILNSSQRYLGFYFANCVQAILFAIIHGSVFLLPVFFLFGLLAGSLYKETKGLLACMAFHIFNNSGALLMTIATLGA